MFHCYCLIIFILYDLKINSIYILFLRKIFNSEKSVRLSIFTYSAKQMWTMLFKCFENKNKFGTTASLSRIVSTAYSHRDLTLYINYIYNMVCHNVYIFMLHFMHWSVYFLNKRLLSSFQLNQLQPRRRTPPQHYSVSFCTVSYTNQIQTTYTNKIFIWFKLKFQTFLIQAKSCQFVHTTLFLALANIPTNLDLYFHAIYFLHITHQEVQ